MTQIEEIGRLIRSLDYLTSGEFYDRMMDYLQKLALADRPAALEALSAHANEDVRKAVSEFQIIKRHEEQSKNPDYVRRNSPLHPGVRLEMFGGYDHYSSQGKPWWLNGQDCYMATFLNFTSYDENAFPAALVEFDEVITLPGHNGRYGVLFATHGLLESIAWGQTEAVVEVHLTEKLPEDLASLQSYRNSASAIETHATYRVEEIS
jgi:hypothetical protein